MRCKFCGYEWKPRKVHPVSCPRCKRRFDYVSQSTDILARAKHIERGFQRTIYVMSLLTPLLEENGVKAVIVGGAAVEFYTRNWYATGDIDLAINKEKKHQFKDVLEKAGFTPYGRMWFREDINTYIEAPADINDIDINKVTKVETDAGYAYIIGMEDIIFDRVQAAEHWKSESDKEQAIRIGAVFYDEIDWDYIYNKCRAANSEKMLRHVMEAAKNARDKTQ